MFKTVYFHLQYLKLFKKEGNGERNWEQNKSEITN